MYVFKKLIINIYYLRFSCWIGMGMAAYIPEALIVNIWGFLRPEEFVPTVSKNWSGCRRIYEIVHVLASYDQKIVDKIMMSLRNQKVEIFLCDNNKLVSRLWILGCLQSVHEMSVRCGSLCDDDVLKLGGLCGLKKLRLLSGKVTDDGIILLMSQLSMSNLEYLDLSGCNISDKSVRVLSKLKCLRKLGINGCVNVTDECLGRLSFLQELSICNTRITGGCMGGMMELRELWMTNCKGCPVTYGMSNSLCFLFLSGTVLLEEDLRRLGELRNLRKLMINGCHNFGVEGAKSLGTLVELKNWNMLEELGLNWCNVTDDGARELIQLGALKELHFRGCDLITDRGISYLALCKRLIDLSFDGKMVTRNGLLVLHNLMYFYYGGNLKEDELVEVVRHNQCLRILVVYNLFEVTDERITQIFSSRQMKRVVIHRSDKMIQLFIDDVMVKVDINMNGYKYILNRCDWVGLGIKG